MYEKYTSPPTPYLFRKFHFFWRLIIRQSFFCRCFFVSGHVSGGNFCWKGSTKFPHLYRWGKHGSWSVLSVHDCISGLETFSCYHRDFEAGSQTCSLFYFSFLAGFISSRLTSGWYCCCIASCLLVFFILRWLNWVIKVTLISHSPCLSESLMWLKWEESWLIFKSCSFQVTDDGFVNSELSVSFQYGFKSKHVLFLNMCL